MREQLGMTPYMMQIALNQTLKQYFKGRVNGVEPAGRLASTRE